jgi:hypothetical protein
MTREALVAGAVACAIGMFRIDGGRYVHWARTVPTAWFVIVLVVQAAAFAASGVAAWALADLLSIEAFGSKWMLNGCVFGVAGFLLLGVQLDALEADKLRAPWVPLKFITRFGASLLDALALKGLESLSDLQLEDRAWTLFFDGMYRDETIAATAREAQLVQLREASAQIRQEHTCAEGRGRLRSFIRWAWQ